ncbi:MAG: putative SbcD/Mre11-related phosphoesterase [Halobacteriales archaeon]|jgi:putative SbcD/Mre11-related phosphoesterase
MVTVEPLPDAPAAVAEWDGGRALVVADLHAGIERALAFEHGVELDSRGEDRRERILALLDRTDPDRIVFLGDLMHSIGDPGGAERGEIEVLFEALPDLPVTLVKGNHDGGIESWVDVSVTDSHGVRFGDLGFAHGHTWPSREVLAADVICVGHEHPCVRLTDEVGGSRVERVWLRGPLARDAFGDDDLDWQGPEGIVFPAFNELAGGTWVNVPEQSFLAPFLPAALSDAEAYLLDGTRLGDLRRI